jgi:M6 family metalloprotease-like protein
MARPLGARFGRALVLLTAVLAAIAVRQEPAEPATGQTGPCRPAPSVSGVTEGRSLPGTVGPSIGTLRAALLLVHAADAPPDAATAPPWELIDAARAWFERVSYRRLALRVDTVPEWFALPGRSADYIADAEQYLTDVVAAADPYVDFTEFDVVYVAPSSRTAETATSAILNGFGVRADGRPIRLWIPFPAGFADEANTDPFLLLHETGHLLGLPDLYTQGAPGRFYRWDVMAARYPAELLAWHRWKLGWLDPGQIVCVTARRSRTTAILTPIERAGGRKAIFVKRGSRVLAVEVRARIGYDATACEKGVLVYEVDQTPFRRAPVHIHAAQPDGDEAPRPGCAALWNAPFDVARGERRSLSLPGIRVDVLARIAGGSYRVRVTTS